MGRFFPFQCSYNYEERTLATQSLRDQFSSTVYFRYYLKISVFTLSWRFQINGDISNFSRMGISNVADGVPEVLRATRLQLRNGATQIKIMAGGGRSSFFDPIDTTQFSKEEISAAVEAAADWGTYVAAHAFTDRAVNRLLECGVKSIEHGFFISEETMQKIAATGFVCNPNVGDLAGFGP